MPMNRLFSVILGVFVVASIPVVAQTREVRFVTWNLGWHLSSAEARQWINTCSQPFTLNPVTHIWEPSTAGNGKLGWELEWGRDAKIAWDIGALPPCDVYQTAAREIVPVTEAAYSTRIRRIRSLLEGQAAADIYAFQEISGAAAVREILPGAPADWFVCTFSGYKIQRLAIAVRSSVGRFSDCLDEPSLSLPSEEERNRPRPGLSATVVIDGISIRVMTVHLKSSCVSPLEQSSSNQNRGQLAGLNEHCVILQKQISPLESWIEDIATIPTVLLGDFNRNISQEKATIPPNSVRLDGSDPRSPRTPSTRSRSLIGEVNDGTPATSELTIIEPACPISPQAEDLCKRIQTQFVSRADLVPLTKPNSLGCRNPVGLDHVLVSPSLAAGARAEKVPLGSFGGTRRGTAQRPDPLLAVSDHCPLSATVRF